MGALRFILLFLILLSLFLVGCTTYPFTGKAVTKEASLEVLSEEVLEEVITKNLLVRDGEFVPNTVVVKKGDMVRLILLNQGPHEHSFILDELDISKTLPLGTSTEVIFTAEKQGVFEFYSDEATKGRL